MKTQAKKWLRWGAAGAFGLMLTLNVMVGLEFEKDEILPSLTLTELGGQAYAQQESFQCEWKNNNCKSPLQTNTCGCE
ncbi:hypothetical protein [Algoriphagus sp. Y33]|uniref:hypothetical protein n=1 Tax=Algoriphagus sp. Y33 TaxID=2772483 RepID=UPI001783477B|nr:hypothetical protein [Algoriphagus sp. Y33]